MPEGPEVKIIADQLNTLCKNKCIWQLDILSGRYIKNLPKGLDLFKKWTIDKMPLDQSGKVKEIKCKGKLIYWVLEDDWFICQTLGMTGSFSLKKEKHSRIFIKITDPYKVNPETNTLYHYNLYYNDIRNFGSLEFIKGLKSLYLRLNGLGPDMLNNPPSKEHFSKILKHWCNKPLCSFLMEQRIMSGVGNYLKSEILYKCKLHPHILCGKLAQEQIDLLYNSIIETIKLSYQNGGSTLKDYYDLSGNKGNFVSLMQVYNKKLDPLGNKISPIKTLDKRTTWIVPEIQRIEK